MIKLKKYRIVRDTYLGYECQVWRLWWPFWCQMGYVNTHSTIEKAKDFIQNYEDEVWRSS